MSAPVALKNHFRDHTVNSKKETLQTMKKMEVKRPKSRTQNGHKTVPSIKDMKSFLPGYDEASSYAYEYSRGSHDYGAGTIPVAGRTIEKLNIEELPMHVGSGKSLIDKSLIDHNRARMGIKSRGKISEEYDLISKFDTTVFNPDTNLTQATIARLKTDLKPQSAVKITTSKKLKSPRAAEYQKVKPNAFGSIESDLGFGFRSRMELNPVENSRKSRLDFLEDPEKAMQMAAKQTEHSIQALKKKIGKKSEQWSTEQFGWDGYHYHQSEISAMKHLEEQKKEQRTASSPQANAKLAEMSRKFRQSLKVNTDMKRAIKTPKSNGFFDSKALLESSSFESMDGNHDRQNTFQQALDEDPFQNDFTTRSSAFLIPSKSKSKHVQIEASAKTKDGTPLVSGRRLKTQKGKRKTRPNDENGNTSASHSTGVVQLRSLLESGNPGSYVTISKVEKDSDDEVFDVVDSTNSIDFNQLKKATSNFAPKSSTPVAKTRSTIKSDMATSPRPTLPPVETKIMSENFHSSSTRSLKKGNEKQKEAKETIPVENFIKQRLGESIKTVDDAAMIANRLGSLMARVALAKKAEGENNNSMDTVGLAKELRELATNIEKDNYSAMDGSSLRSSGSMETQTEREKSNAKFLLQPKFTKQMSYTDQLVLRRLREIRQDWAKVGVDSFSQSSDLDKHQN